MDEAELRDWFAALQARLEPSYLAATEPWRQSGFSGPFDRWEACRRPIAECVRSPGAFLDIGCANGYLLECLLRWTAEDGTTIEPWGLDMSAGLIELARARLPAWAGDLFVGNALTWPPVRKFDYVRTELCYVPDELHRGHVSRLLEEFLSPGGRLLVAEYRGRSDPSSGPWIDDVLGQAGFAVEFCASGLWEGKELTRVAVVPKPSGG